MAQSLHTNMQYSKSMGVKRLDKNPFNEPAKFELINTTQLKSELRPTFEILGATNNKTMVWYDYAVIKLSTLFESLANIGLVRKFDCTLRLWLNTGTVNITVANPNKDSTSGTQYY